MFGSASFAVVMRSELVPRFFFHLYDDVVSRDPEGRELPDREAAKDVALASAKEMICDEVRKGRLALKHRIEVESEQGQTVCVLHFRDALEIAED